MIAHKWHPITPLPETWDYDFSEIDSLHRQWFKLKNARENASPGAFDAFLERLTRSWSIETGIIEGLYTLEQGMTETLVMRGISGDLIDQDSTNRDPYELALILEDHQEAVHGVYAEIKEGRPITRSAIRQLHSVLTKNQPTYSAVDQFGRRFDSPLDHGGFKKLPNNPTRPDGALHEYCPPEHVDTELDNLLVWYDLYANDTRRYHPLLTAAWFHHRFTQIHPFQDGNGRVVRALLTWHLVRADYLPAVVTRDHRPQYISALEKADQGYLNPLVDLLVQLQTETILDSLDGLESDYQPSSVGEALEYVVRQIEHQELGVQFDREAANAVADHLSANIADWLSHQGEIIADRLDSSGCPVLVQVDRTGGHFVPGHYQAMGFMTDIGNAGYSVNQGESLFFTELSLTPTHLLRQPKLIFVVFLHHAGANFTGVMAANSFAIIEHYRYDERLRSEDPFLVEKERIFNHNDPFVFTLNDDPDTISPRWIEWTEQKLAKTLQDWSGRFS